MTAEIRARCRRTRRAVPEETRDAWSRQIESLVFSWDVFVRAGAVLCYLPVGEEAGSVRLAEGILDAGKRLLLPRCRERGIMEAVQVTSLSQLAPDVYGIPAPAADMPSFLPEGIDLVLVPGTAFDRAGGRIGQGGGCYDRFLPKTGAVKAGIAFSLQVTEERLPVMAHDVSMDALITERERIIFG